MASQMSSGMGTHVRLSHLLLSEDLGGTEKHGCELSPSGVAAPAALGQGLGSPGGGEGHQHTLGEHPMATAMGTAGRPAFGGMQQLTCHHRIFFLLGGTNYPHTSNISSHFHNQLTSALYHQASEKGVVTQLLKDGRDLLAGIHNKGRPCFPT